MKISDHNHRKKEVIIKLKVDLALEIMKKRKKETTENRFPCWNAECFPGPSISKDVEELARFSK